MDRDKESNLADNIKNGFPEIRKDHTVTQDHQAFGYWVAANIFEDMDPTAADIGIPGHEHGIDILDINIQGTVQAWLELMYNDVDQFTYDEITCDNNPDIKEGFDMWYENETDGRQRIGESALIHMLTKAIQEISAKVEDLENNKE